MKQFSNISDAINWIESVRRFGDKLDLSRMKLATKLLKNPEKSLRIIHVAGTNGKGSTVSFLRHLLQENGYSVGTFTSPYIVSFNERIAINGEYISDDDLLRLINEIYVLFEEVKIKYSEIITFFELTTLISFIYFKQKKPDFVIYEVGLGGRLDATNIVVPEITVITTIGFDHMNVLGNTIEKIALEKLGIVKEDIPLVTAITQDSLKELFANYCKKHNSKVYFINDDDIESVKFEKLTTFKYKGESYGISLIGYHQIRNAVLALETIEIMHKNDIVSIQTNLNKKALIKTSWPGRLERFNKIILDGAHNIDSMNALKDTITTYFRDANIKVLYTSMEDKEYFDVIRIIEQFAKEICFTEIPYYRCASAETLYTVSNHLSKKIIKDPIKAFNMLKASLQENDILLVTGSLYFISLIRKELV